MTVADPKMETARRMQKIAKRQQVSQNASESLFRGEHRSLWNFWRDGITSSFVDCWLSCREQSRLIYCEGWSPRDEPLAFAFGTCGHWVLEQAYKRLPDKRFPPKREWILAKIKQYEKYWLSTVPSPTQHQLEQQQLVYGLAEQVLPVYFIRWDGDFTGKYKYGSTTTVPAESVSTEKVFKVPYTFADGRTTCLRGKRDWLFRDKRGKLWVFDSKHQSVIIEDDILDTLPANFQQMLYLHSVVKEYNEYPVGCILNVVRRPGHRRRVAETLPDFLERVGEEVADPKQFDHNFIRFQLAIGRDEIDNWVATRLDPIMHDIRGWWEGTVAHYPADKHLTTKYGRCGMFLPILKNDFSRCYRRKDVFPELVEV